MTGFVLSVAAMLVVGGLVGRFSGRGVVKGALRQFTVGALAAAVTFVIGNFSQFDSLSLLEAANSITAAIANEFAEADAKLHQPALMYLGLVLFFITFCVLSLSKLLLMRLDRGEGART